MARDTYTTKCRLCRAEGIKLYLKGTRYFTAKCPIDKRAGITPGMHGAKRARKASDYALQLRAKQKAKRLFGVLETQFHNYYTRAKTMTGQVGDNLLTLLERRLDNIVYLSGLALSRPQAKQMVSHGHILVNGKKINIGSLLLTVGDEVSYVAKSADSAQELSRISTEKDFNPPDWLDVDKSAYKVKVARLPGNDDFPQEIDVNLIIEYYSR
jgi:small subunit ribosomal protein S4